MDYDIVEKDNKIIIKNMKDFHPKHIFECGQAFRWQVEEDQSYTAVHGGKVLNVKKEGEDVVFSNTNISGFYDIWYDYFDLGRDYGKIKEELSKDPILKEAIEFGEGIRILNQDPFETTISFIISANNQIPRIKRSIELISQNYGKPIGSYNGKKYYTFPSSEVLAKAKEEELEENCKVGYRAKYIVNTSNIINDKEVELDELFKLPTEEAKEILMKLPGVGPKVSNCILLFSLNKNDAFPVDVWVKRVMEHFYFKEDTSNKKIASYAEEKFGNLGGFAQQYLFYYARELGIGRKNK
ncbi:DNA-3-methyladenine glycosylase family protein [Clostridium sp. Cult3]|uniref:DNA-3-methyladenine glycosylase family protein n=1 Tax=Clostridium sp. Cult3 TaxID=2079004 RepID=UPI001F359013|nr:DNA glycosylase [Clostridium sp. Cult3]MCF6461231.1 8-oxoguanine DNA glycosylase [Clostridium sp. Cult3]